jgi:hypothetical protein
MLFDEIEGANAPSLPVDIDDDVEVAFYMQTA